MSSDTNWLEFFQDRERLHANYYLDFAHQHARRAPEAYEQLEAESGNLLKIASWLAEYNEAEGVLELAKALWQQSDFIRTRGFFQRGFPLLQQAHAAAQKLGNVQAEFTWLEALAEVHLSTGNPAAAQPLFEQALTLAQESNDLALIARSQLDLGRLLMEMGQLDEAAIWLKQALQNYHQIQRYEGEIDSLVALGNLLSLQGNSAEAVAYLEQGLPLVQAQQDRHGEAVLYNALGYAAALTQEWPQAIKYYEISTDIVRTIGDRYLEVRGLHNLGEAWLILGDVQQAIFLLEQALVRQETIDDILTKAFTHLYLGKAYHILNKPIMSLVQLKQTYPFRQVPVLRNLAAEAAWIMADNYLKLGDTNSAKMALQDSLTLAPDDMSDIRCNSEILLQRIESGEISECSPNK